MAPIAGPRRRRSRVAAGDQSGMRRIADRLARRIAGATGRPDRPSIHSRPEPRSHARALTATGKAVQSRAEALTCMGGGREVSPGVACRRSRRMGMAAWDSLGAVARESRRMGMVAGDSLGAVARGCRRMGMVAGDSLCAVPGRSHRTGMAAWDSLGAVARGCRRQWIWRFGLLAIAGMLAFGAGCRRADDRAAIQDRLRTKGSAEVVREAAAAQRYTPPANGRLTEAQVRMYLKVREREDRIREAAAQESLRRDTHADAAGQPPAGERTPESPADRAADRAAPASGSAPSGADTPPADSGLAAADLRAAQELHVNPREYSWVRERVLEAQTAATTLALFQKMAAGREQLLTHMRRDLEAQTDPAKRAAAARDIEDWKRGLQSTEPTVPPAVRANVALLARFREPLARLAVLEDQTLATSAGLETPPPAPTPKPAH